MTCTKKELNQVSKIEVLKIFNNKIDLLFVFFLLFAISLHIIWIFCYTSIPFIHGSDLNIEAIRINSVGLNGKIGTFFNWGAPTTLPHLSYLFLFFYSIFGVESKKEFSVNIFFLAILLVSTYKIGEIIYNKKVGLLSSLIITSFPVVQYISKSGFREFYLLSFLTLSFFFLLKTNKFKNRKATIIFAISLAISGIIKYNHVIYVLPTVIFYLIYSLRDQHFLFKKNNSRELSKMLINLGLLAFIYLLLCGSWYIFNFNKILNTLNYRFNSNTPELNVIKEVIPTDTLLFNTKVLSHNITFVFLILFLLALIVKLTKTKTIREILLISSFLFPFLIYSLMPIRFWTMLVPAYFAIPLVISDFLLNYLPRNMKKAMLCLVIIYALVWLFMPFLKVPNTSYPERFSSLGTPEWISQLNLYMPKPTTMEKVILELNATNDEPTKILVLGGDMPAFWELTYVGLIKNKEYNISAVFIENQNGCIAWYSENQPDSHSEIGVELKKKEYEYILLWNYDFLLNQHCLSSYIHNLESNTNYSLIKEIPYYGTTTIKIYSFIV